MKFISISDIFTRLEGRRGQYHYGVDVLNAKTSFQTISRELEKVSCVLQNPAVLKVFALQCDLFSMAQISVDDQNGKPIEDDPFLVLMRQPDLLPSSNQSQFLWDFMFWNMLGTAYCYVDSRIVDRQPRNIMYFLEPYKIIWPQELEKLRDKLILSEAEVKKIMKMTIGYRYDDGSTFSFPMDRLVISFDLTNGVGNHFKGPSRLDALYKIISNSEHVLDSQNINVRYTGKFIVASETSSGTTVKPPLSSEEIHDIRVKMDGSKDPVYPLNKMVEIRRFVENYANLQLSQEYLANYFLIGNMYNIPRDVLEAYNSATYENQEKARAAHVNYCLEPKGNVFMNQYENHFSYTALKKNIVMSWKHLPFMQVFEKERVETKKITVEVLTSLLSLGVDIEQVNEYLGTEFEIKETEPQENVSTMQEEGGTDASQDQEIGGREQEESPSDQEAKNRKRGVNGFSNVH